MTTTIAIALFDKVELLDFCGPYEVFSCAARKGADVKVFTVAPTPTVLSHNGLEVVAHYSLDQAPPSDWLLVPGGVGTRGLLENECYIQWLKVRAAQVSLLMSVCTGSLVLAKAGLVGDHVLTTHHSALEELRALAPNNPIDASARYLDHGSLMVSAGISAGTDMAFHAVRRFFGEELATTTARYMEYDWTP